MYSELSKSGLVHAQQYRLSVDRGVLSGNTFKRRHYLMADNEPVGEQSAQPLLAHILALDGER
jgi:hypothetical protein